MFSSIFALREVIAHRTWFGSILGTETDNIPVFGMVYRPVGRILLVGGHRTLVGGQSIFIFFHYFYKKKFWGGSGHKCWWGGREVWWGGTSPPCPPAGYGPDGISLLFSFSRELRVSVVVNLA